ncbi:unnamed protein product [Polarella glacialis]|uniref:Uncharacterized protein n=1 Tax=Polarella glacialis TaxID=89957 RepID=A0A813KGE5_POLGL|nr:unnamed protein product [Polarella glacialis]
MPTQRRRQPPSPLQQWQCHREPPERRIDPSDGIAYSWDELCIFYKDSYSSRDIQSYWHACATLAEGADVKDSPYHSTYNETKANDTNTSFAYQDTRHNQAVLRQQQPRQQLQATKTVATKTATNQDGKCSAQEQTATKQSGDSSCNNNKKHNNKNNNYNNNNNNKQSGDSSCNAGRRTKRHWAARKATPPPPTTTTATTTATTTTTTTPPQPSVLRDPSLQVESGQLIKLLLDVSFRTEAQLADVFQLVGWTDDARL